MEAHLKTYGLFILIIALTFIFARVVSKLFRRLIKKSATEMSSDTTNYQFLRHVCTGLVYILGFSAAIYTLPALRSIATSMLAGAGILAVAIGFAAQAAFSNIISGVFIVMFKPFRIGDRLNIQQLAGIVEDITLRHTVLRDFENRRIIIPNAVISNEIIVNSDFGSELICKFIDIGISYDSDIDLAKTIIENEILNHPLQVDPRTEVQKADGVAEVPVRVMLLGESSVDLRGWAWAIDAPNGFVLKCDLLESIKKRFDREGVEIPFPHRTIVTKGA